jgi:hypothetical protein
MLEYIKQIAFAFFTSVSIVIIFSFVVAIPVFSLWNVTMPQIFGLPEIGWIDAALLYMLFGILFSSTGRGN